MSGIRGVIFDVDGTLVDSNDAHARAWVEALAEFGYDAQLDHARRLIGMGGDKILPELAGIKKESPEGARISEFRAELFKNRYRPHLKRFPGSKELLAKIAARGLRIVVASSAQKDELKHLLEIAGATEYVEDVASSTDADRSKPDPDIVQAAFEHLGLSKSEVVMIGDTPYDIEAAARAGIRTIGFRSGGYTDSGLEGAIAVYDGPADLCENLDSSVLAGDGGARESGEARLDTRSDLPM
jgi:HAD superfamily hydrolase (TIGR01549 family)